MLGGGARGVKLPFMSTPFASVRPSAPSLYNIDAWYIHNKSIRLPQSSLPLDTGLSMPFIPSKHTSPPRAPKWNKMLPSKTFTTSPTDPDPVEMAENNGQTDTLFRPFWYERLRGLLCCILSSNEVPESSTASILTIALESQSCEKTPPRKVGNQSWDQTRDAIVLVLSSRHVSQHASVRSRSDIFKTALFLSEAC